MQEEPSEEQRRLILKNWAKLNASRRAVDDAKQAMVATLDVSASNLEAYSRRTTLVRSPALWPPSCWMLWRT